MSVNNTLEFACKTLAVGVSSIVNTLYLVHRGTAIGTLQKIKRISL